MKKSQRERIITKLLADGFVTRNEALRNHITRLSAIILLLKEEGWEFTTSDDRGDYRYELIKAPNQYAEQGSAQVFHQPGLYS